MPGIFGKRKRKCKNFTSGSENRTGIHTETNGDPKHWFYYPFIFVFAKRKTQDTRQERALIPVYWKIREKPRFLPGKREGENGTGVNSDTPQ
jgi:hypothetical protein